MGQNLRPPTYSSSRQSASTEYQAEYLRRPQPCPLIFARGVQDVVDSMQKTTSSVDFLQRVNLYLPYFLTPLAFLSRVHSAGSGGQEAYQNS